MSLSDLAYKRFKELLFEKVWKPGDFVSQSELVEKTGVQLSPMRDALQKLNAEGLVNITPRKGIQVTPASTKMIREVFQIRKIIEKEAVIYFVEHATSEIFDNLQATQNSLMERAKNENHPDTLSELMYLGEIELHSEIVNYMGNDLISSLYHLNADRIRLFRLDSDFPYTNVLVLTAFKEHIDVIEAMIRRESEKAVEKIDFHISMSLKRALGPPFF